MMAPSLLHEFPQDSLVNKLAADTDHLHHRQSFLLRSSPSKVEYPAEKNEDLHGLRLCSMTKPAKATFLLVKAQREQEEKEETKAMISSEIPHSHVQEDVHELHSLISSLKNCIQQRDLETGSKIHATIATRGGLEENIFLANTLINLYAKCGELAKAQELCDKLRVRTVVSWNILIAGYAEHGPAEEALRCFEWMQLENLSPNAATFTCLLKACISIRKLDKIQDLHIQIEKNGILEKDVVVGTTLVDAYGKLGVLTKAQEVFDKLPVHDAISWNVLITGYAQHGYGQDALKYFDQMRHRGFYPDDVTFVASFKACASLGAANTGQLLHAEIVKFGLDGSDVIVTNSLIDMYAKCGLLAESQAVFDKLPNRDIVSFGGLIEGYAQHNYSEDAMRCFERMQSEGISPNVVIFVSILKACSCLEALNRGFHLHSQIVKEGFLENDVFVSRALLDMYGQCGLLEEAQKVFDRLSHRDVFSFNLLISVYSKNGFDEQALSCFERMQDEGLFPNSITLVFILKVCANMGFGDKGQQIHEQIISCHSLVKNLAVGTTLVDMYASCGLLVKAQEVFDMLPIHDLVSWNALIGGYSKYGHGYEAMHYFNQLKVDGLLPDVVTFMCALKACSAIGAVYVGLEIHAEIEKVGFLEDDDPMVGTTLVDMYAKCGLFADAQQVFDGLPNRDITSWNVLITEYAKSGLSEQALLCFESMQLAGLSANRYTFSSALKSCASYGVIHVGQDMHMKAVKGGFGDEEIVVMNALVDMYSNFGMLRRAEEVFDSSVVRDVVSWNSLLGGYSQLGKEKSVFEVFEKMVSESVQPDMITMTILLNICSHTGLLETGQELFKSITTQYNIKPNLEHHTCIIDMFGRAGQLDKVFLLIKEIPFLATSTLWNVVLCACQKWGKTDFADLAF